MGLGMNLPPSVVHVLVRVRSGRPNLLPVLLAPAVLPTPVGGLDEQSAQHLLPLQGLPQGDPAVMVRALLHVDHLVLVGRPLRTLDQRTEEVAVRTP